MHLRSFIVLTLFQMKLSFRRPMMKLVLIIQPIFFVLLTWFTYIDSMHPRLGAQIIIAGGLTTLWTGIIFSRILQKWLILF